MFTYPHPPGRIDPAARSAPLRSALPARSKIRLIRNFASHATPGHAEPRRGRYEAVTALNATH